MENVMLAKFIFIFVISDRIFYHTLNTFIDLLLKFKINYAKDHQTTKTSMEGIST